ncbi:3-isopropylmalate dehydratase small subunit [Cenarchaeum symbiosum A]|uniref:3-isopropylmalate dehydratase n=1 Tax=Cenarchaeum symbiosum (strain A) TaxID=414004 RepID=A0RXP2_CENSY|nr:3-isopropylmalate dehydratase small subunit [Cenarchaeum symbiosum A]
MDTDQIVPKQFLKLLTKTGFGDFLFFDWRYGAGREPDPEFVLNDPAYAGSRILAAGENFGCGSSREHAVWALRDYGFAAVIAPSFADIFYSNCFKNGVLPVVLGEEAISALAGSEATVDLDSQEVRSAKGTFHFDVDPHRKRMLLEGLDDISLTLEHESEIAKFEGGPRAPSSV